MRTISVKLPDELLACAEKSREGAARTTAGRFSFVLRLGARSCRYGEGAAERSGRRSQIYGRFWPAKEGPGLLDTGPLVSFLASGLRHHSWTCEQWKLFRPPLLTCEPVLTEAAFSSHETGRPRGRSPICP